tara:strand:+ start:161 stop:850 length:690 start_codon:yes stop_codon:yes gene_type:complete
MKAKSTGLKIPKSKSKNSQKKPRLPHAERRELILNQAADFFSEYGLTGQTRSLAAASGISQRLLYRFFTTKAALLAEVYARTILGPFRADWLADLSDRSKPMETRLLDFYIDYYEIVLTRRWLRLFLYSSLADESMAPDYISAIITKLMETIVIEIAADQNVKLPNGAVIIHELGWTLHGTISHLAIRRHLYKASDSIDNELIIRMHIRAFLGGFKDMVDTFSTNDPAQ